MAGYDFRSPRLYVEAPLEEGADVVLDGAQAHYLGTVLRLKSGSRVLVFNGRDGEWSATLALHRRAAALAVVGKTRSQTAPADLHYMFAPLKAARLDYMVQKAVEMGVSRLQPVLTRHSQVTRVNTERMRANAIEAAEQCGILWLPDIEPPAPLARLLAARDPARRLVFCDEDAEQTNPVAALAGLERDDLSSNRHSALSSWFIARPDGKPVSTFPGRALAPSPLAVLIGPEGGFADDERAALLKLPNVVRLSLGPRILRADTAAVAALALVQAVIGDWR